MNIGEVAQRSGVPAKTIRYYEDIGLIAPPRRSEAGYRIYGGDDVQTLRFVNRARSLGFSIKDVDSLLTLWRDRERQSAEVKGLALEQVERIEKKIGELQEMRNTLLDLARRCHGDRRPHCPILADLAGEQEGVEAL
ncbi:MAG: Cu(I)-responsive transcriptional regulator [Rhodovibrionaceae bacterium]|nr:Cu(I)-responsive transcriptional regulator [Rhodovibrionaceae bacterium]